MASISLGRRRGAIHRLQSTSNLRAKSAKSASDEQIRAFLFYLQRLEAMPDGARIGAAATAMTLWYTTTCAGQRSIGGQPSAAPVTSAQLEIESKTAASTLAPICCGTRGGQLASRCPPNFFRGYGGRMPFIQAPDRTKLYYEEVGTGS